MLRDTTLADVLPVLVAAVATVSVHGALAFEKYRFNNGLVLGTTLAAVDWYEHTARRRGLPQSRGALILVATSAAGVTLILQHAASALTR
jgi:hypothetical protein